MKNKIYYIFSALVVVLMLVVTSCNKNTEELKGYFNSNVKEYTLSSDYVVKAKDDIDFDESVTIDLNNSVLDLNGQVLNVNTSSACEYVFKNGTISNGEINIVASKSKVTFENVTIDNSITDVTLSGQVILNNVVADELNILNGSLNVNTNKLDDAYTYQNMSLINTINIDEAANYLTLTVDKHSVIGNINSNATSLIDVSGTVANIVLNGEGSFFKASSTANVHAVYAYSKNIILDIDSDSLVQKLYSNTESKDTLFLYNAVLESEQVEFIPNCKIDTVKNLCTEVHTYVRYKYVDKDGIGNYLKIETNKCHTYDEADVVINKNYILGELKEYTCQECGSHIREITKADRSIFDCDNFLDLVLLYVPDFNIDYSIDKEMSFVLPLDAGDTTVKINNAYVHIVSNNGNITGALVFDSIINDKVQNYKMYLNNGYLYLANRYETEDEESELQELTEYITIENNQKIDLYDTLVNLIADNLLESDKEELKNTLDTYFNYVQTGANLIDITLTNGDDAFKLVYEIIESALLKVFPSNLVDNLELESILFDYDEVNNVYTLDFNNITDTLEMTVLEVIDKGYGENTTSNLITYLTEVLPTLTLGEATELLLEFAKENNIDSEKLFETIDLVANNFDEEKDFDIYALINENYDICLNSATLNEIDAIKALNEFIKLDNLNEIKEMTLWDLYLEYYKLTNESEEITLPNLDDLKLIIDEIDKSFDFSFGFDYDDNINYLDYDQYEVTAVYEEVEEESEEDPLLIGYKRSTYPSLTVNYDDDVFSISKHDDVENEKKETIISIDFDEEINKVNFDSDNLIENYLITFTYDAVTNNETNAQFNLEYTDPEDEKLNSQLNAVYKVASETTLTINGVLNAVDEYNEGCYDKYTLTTNYRENDNTTLDSVIKYESKDQNELITLAYNKDNKTNYLTSSLIYKITEYALDENDEDKISEYEVFKYVIDNDGTHLNINLEDEAFITYNKTNSNVYSFVYTDIKKDANGNPIYEKESTKISLTYEKENGDYAFTYQKGSNEYLESLDDEENIHEYNANILSISKDTIEDGYDFEFKYEVFNYDEPSCLKKDLILSKTLFELSFINKEADYKYDYLKVTVNIGDEDKFGFESTYNDINNNQTLEIEAYYSEQNDDVLDELSVNLLFKNEDNKFDEFNIELDVDDYDYDTEKEKFVLDEKSKLDASLNLKASSTSECGIIVNFLIDYLNLESGRYDDIKILYIKLDQSEKTNGTLNKKYIDSDFDLTYKYEYSKDYDRKEVGFNYMTINFGQDYTTYSNKEGVTTGANLNDLDFFYTVKNNNDALGRIYRYFINIDNAIENNEVITNLNANAYCICDSGEILVQFDLDENNLIKEDSIQIVSNNEDATIKVLCTRNSYIVNLDVNAKFSKNNASIKVIGYQNTTNKAKVLNDFCSYYNQVEGYEDLFKYESEQYLLVDYIDFYNAENDFVYSILDDNIIYDDGELKGASFKGTLDLDYNFENNRFTEFDAHLEIYSYELLKSMFLNSTDCFGIAIDLKHINSDKEFSIDLDVILNIDTIEENSKVSNGHYTYDNSSSTYNYDGILDCPSYGLVFTYNKETTEYYFTIESYLARYKDDNYDSVNPYSPSNIVNPKEFKVIETSLIKSIEISGNKDEFNLTNYMLDSNYFENSNRKGKKNRVTIWDQLEELFEGIIVEYYNIGTFKQNGLASETYSIKHSEVNGVNTIMVHIENCLDPYYNEALTKNDRSYEWFEYYIDYSNSNGVYNLHIYEKTNEDNSCSKKYDSNEYVVKEFINITFTNTEDLFEFTVDDIDDFLDELSLLDIIIVKGENNSYFFYLETESYGEYSRTNLFNLYLDDNSIKVVYPASNCYSNRASLIDAFEITLSKDNENYNLLFEGLSTTDPFEIELNIDKDYKFDCQYSYSGYNFLDLFGIHFDFDSDRNIESFEDVFGYSLNDFVVTEE